MRPDTIRSMRSALRAAARELRSEAQDKFGAGNDAWSNADSVRARRYWREARRAGALADRCYELATKREV